MKSVSFGLLGLGALSGCSVPGAAEEASAAEIAALSTSAAPVVVEAPVSPAASSPSLDRSKSLMEAVVGLGDDKPAVALDPADGRSSEASSVVAGLTELEKLRADLAAKDADLTAKNAEMAPLLEAKTKLDKQASDAVLMTEMQTALVGEVDRLEALVESGQLSAEDAEAQALALGQSWLQEKQATGKVAELEARLAKYEAKEKQDSAMAELKTLVADSPEFKVGGEAAMKMALDKITGGAKPADAVKEVQELIAALGSHLGLSAADRAAAAAKAGPTIGGGSEAGGGGSVGTGVSLVDRLKRLPG